VTWRRPRPRIRPDLTSLIDVVFMLLIFLIVAAQFDRQGELDVALPRDDRASSTDTRLIVTVKADAVLIGGVAVAGDPGIEAARRSSRVVLQADASVPYDKVFHVLSSLSKAGVTDVALAYQVGN
jgi:biopolymer transport protein ExbD